MAAMLKKISAGLSFLQIGTSLNVTRLEEDQEEPLLDDLAASSAAIDPAAAGMEDTDARPSTPTTAVVTGIEEDDTGPSAPPAAAAAGMELHRSPPVAVTSGITLGTAKGLTELSTEAHLFIAPDKIAMASLVFGVIVLALSVSAMYVRAWRQSQPQGIREKAEKLRVTRQAQLESMVGLNGPLKPGKLVRIQGRVVPESQGSLVAPLSSQQCVMYSASISHQRHDGIHQPVAFRSESTDFAIELSGSPTLRIAVHSQDVALFDMVEGKLVREYSLAEAPDAWRAFLLAHCVPGQDASSSVSLGTDDSALDFRESALVQGAEVTCIGEIARDRNGSLALLPWRPSPNTGTPGAPLQFAGEDKTLLQKVVASLARRVGRPVTARRESLVGRVMISDDPEFLS